MRPTNEKEGGLTWKTSIPSVRERKRERRPRKQVALSICNGLRSWYLLRGWETALPTLLPALLLATGMGYHWSARPNGDAQDKRPRHNGKNARVKQEDASEKETKKLQLLEMENKLLMEKVMEMEVALKKFL